VQTSAELFISKTATPNPVIAGSQLIYEVRVTNVGPSDAQNVSVTDNLPAEVTGAFYCTGTGCSSFITPWSSPLLLGAVASGNTVVIRIQATVKSDTPNGRSEERRVGKECRSRWAQDQ